MQQVWQNHDYALSLTHTCCWLLMQQCTHERMRTYLVWAPTCNQSSASSKCSNFAVVSSTTSSPRSLLRFFLAFSFLALRICATTSSALLGALASFPPFKCWLYCVKHMRPRANLERKRVVEGKRV